MPLKLSPVLLSDLPSIHHLSLSADQDSPTAQVLFPHHASATSIAHLVAQDEIEMQNPQSTSRHVMVRDVPDEKLVREGSVEKKGEVVSYAMWNYFVGRKKEDGVIGDEAYYEEWPSDVNKDAIGVLFGKGKKMREETMGDRDYCLLATICTAPTHRRMGAASQLMEWGLGRADAHYLPTYVEATAAGLPLYLKYGFQKVNTLEIDLRPWGSSHVTEHAILVRPAKPPDASIDEISLSPVLTNQDFIAFTSIEDKAFTPAVPGDEGGMELFRLINNNVPTSNQADFRIKSLIHNKITDPSARYLKAFIPRTNQIIGFANWNVCLSPSIHPAPDSWPEGANKALIDALFGKAHREMQMHMKEKPYLFMHILVVAPEWQRKGVGMRLLKWGLELADREGVECWIDASAEGLGLYKKVGWREVGETVVDLGQWGGTVGKREKVVHLIRRKGGVV